MSRAIQCRYCGGTQGTLVKAGDAYKHMRVIDCVLYRAAKERKAKILQQARQTK